MIFSTNDKVRLKFAEENIWLIELIYVYTPLYIKANLSFATMTNSLNKALAFSISLASNIKEDWSLSAKPELSSLQKIYLDKITAIIIANDYDSYSKLNKISSFNDLNNVKGLLGKLTDWLIKKKKK